MKFIKISTKKTNNSNNNLDFNIQDYYTASFMLKETVSNLKTFVRYLSILTQDQFLSELLNSKVIEQTNRYSLTKKGDIYLVVNESEYDWETIILSYILKYTFRKQRAETFKDMLLYLETKRIRRGLFINELNKMKRKILEYKEEEDNRPINYINYYRLAKIFKRNGIASVKRDDENEQLILTFDNVKLGNDEEGYMLYKHIIIYIKDWGISEFELIFNNFRYSSKAKGLEDIILHPYIKPPYMFNDILTWINPNDYITFAEFIVDLVTRYQPNSGLKTIKEIIDEYNKLRKLWI